MKNHFHRLSCINSTHGYYFPWVLVVLLPLMIQCRRSVPVPENNVTEVPPDNPVKVEEDAFAFPGAGGGGRLTTGGTGGMMIKVTTLADAGPGSLRDAIAQPGARTIVFEVSGNIILQSKLRIVNGDVTIAGQSAPGDGICIQNHVMNVAADNVIIHFMRFRMGDLTRNEQDAQWGRYHQNIVIDHCSMSWSIDECSSFYANHNSRQPRFNGGNRTSTGSSPFGIYRVDFRNNVIYNGGANSACGGENGSYNIVANYYKPRPATDSSKVHRMMEISKEKDLVKYAPGYGKYYVSDIFVDSNPTVSDNNWNGGMDEGSGLSTTDFENAKLNTPLSLEFLALHSALQAYNAVLLYGGTSLHRDSEDTRVISEVKEGTFGYYGSKTGKKGMVYSQTDVGGWPELHSQPPFKDSDGDGMHDDWEILNKLNPNKTYNIARNLSTAYDDLEV